MMAVGKTTIARIVAKKHNLKFVDTDLNITKSNSMTIAEIFKNKGENFFREKEEKERGVVCSGRFIATTSITPPLGTTFHEFHFFLLKSNNYSAIAPYQQEPAEC